MPKDTGRTMRRGGEDDPRVPVHKRRNSYGQSVIEVMRTHPGTNPTAKSSKDFADAVDRGDPLLDAGHRDGARSLEGHDEMTKKSKAEIARRLYNRSNHK